MLHGHGDDIYFLQKKVRYNFSSNVWQYPFNDELKKHLSQKLDCLHSYPEPAAESLKSLLQKKHSVGNSQLIVTNGATEAFYMVAKAWQGGRSLIAVPSFSEYEDAARHAGHECIFIEERTAEIIAGVPADLVWLCNPNNPDGFVYSADMLLTLLRRFPERVFVIDEVYIDFAERAESLCCYVSELPNLIIVKSLTKKYTMPALRLGYLLCSTVLYQRLIAQKQPWSVNSLAVEAGKYVLNAPDCELQLIHYKKECRSFFEMLSAVGGVEVADSDANFFLCRLKHGSVAVLKEYLIDQHQMLIRDASNFRSLNNSFFRVCSLGSKADALFCEALRHWVSNLPC